MADFTITPAAVTVNAEAVLDGSKSFDPDGSLVAFQWSVTPPSGPLWTATGESVRYKPAVAGGHKVSLTVMADNGEMASAARDLTVNRAGLFPPSVTRPRIMLLGDSLTGGSGCWKKLFNAKLMANGITSYEFVGSRRDDCGGGILHEGHSCATAQNFTNLTYTNNCSGQEAGLRTLLERNKPDMVMMTLGTNDAWGVPGTAAILRSYTTLVEQMRAHNPSMVIAVAQIPKMLPDGNQAVYRQVEDLVKAVPAWAQGLNRPESPIIVADLWTNFSIADTSDGVHPTDNVGHPKVADNWYNAVGELLRGR